MNQKKFTKMFQAYADAIYKFAYYRLNDVEKAEDITSIVFTKAWEARNTYKGPSEQAWLFTIARNTLIDSYRKHKDERLDKDENTISHDSTADDLDSELAVQKLRLALRKIAPELQDIIELRYIERISVKDTAQRLNISEANVRVKQHRALQKLRILYENQS